MSTHLLTHSPLTKIACEILGKHRPVRMPWVTADAFDLCDKRRELKNKGKEVDGTRTYRAVSREKKDGMTKAT